mmetsp:Transcript_23564/g.56487  ORF Transcript_23564/g.56487 Transcript_23564/m.56487 type:complete len:228 (+) Transcript_23564:326-1009(+)
MSVTETRPPASEGRVSRSLCVRRRSVRAVRSPTSGGRVRSWLLLRFRKRSLVRLWIWAGSAVSSLPKAARIWRLGSSKTGGGTMLKSLFAILSLVSAVRSATEAGSDLRWFCDRLSLVSPPSIPNTRGSEASWLDARERELRLPPTLSHIHEGHWVKRLLLKLSLVMDGVTICVGHTSAATRLSRSMACTSTTPVKRESYSRLRKATVTSRPLSRISAGGLRSTVRS